MPNACYNPANGQLLGTEKSLLAIYQEINSLTTAQKSAIWTDFTSGSPPKWSRDGEAGTHGAHADALAAMSIPAIEQPVNASFPAAVQTAARLRMVAIYLLDNPLYLANPAFDPAIDVRPYAVADAAADASTPA